ncbi:polymer-forming cytoskeletal protein [Polaribacter vadi]|uniref:bactofilin family protein n=1 Tax=Polaribacter vadi TaxID=1774273 RepID=UPI0030EC23ED|tara:strand:+ start:88154 stop:88588 length:435 start_codon:yes stop_codon:yes gene_type:complete
MSEKQKEETSKNKKPRKMERNVIAKNTTIKGEIISDGDYRIDGVLEGDLKTKGRVIIGSGGVVDGTIEASNTDIEGTFSGKLTVEKILTVKAIAKISGEVVVGKLSIEPGAAFNASCTMKAIVKEVNKEDGKKSKKEGDKKTFK